MRVTFPAASIAEAFDALAVPVWFVAQRNGDIQHENPCARALCGWTRTRRRAIGRLAEALSIEIDSRRRPIALEDIRHLMIESRKAGTYVGWLTNPAGSVRLRLSAGPFGASRDPPTIILSGIAEGADLLLPASTTGLTAVAQSVAHEFNNIGASLLGFVELAAEQTQPDSVLGHCFSELRLGVSRLGALASTLELLSEEAGKSTSVSAADCVIPLGGDNSSAGYEVTWNCESSTRVEADAAMVRETLRVMAPLSAARTRSGAAAYTVGLIKSGAAMCSFCSGAVADGGVRVSATDYERRRNRPTLHRLIVTAAAHGAHCAGAHAALDAAGHSFSILLPRERPEAVVSEL